MKTLILIFPLLVVSFGKKIEITEFKAYAWQKYNITVLKSGIFNETTEVTDFEEGDMIKFKCLANRPWKKCWIYKEFEQLGCKSTHHAGYQVESNCDNGIEWSGSFRVCAVTLLAANRTEDTQWRCMVEEEVFIGDPSFTETPEPLALNITTTINEITTTEAPKPEKITTEAPKPTTEKPTI